jgi:hypothetical protein
MSIPNIMDVLKSKSIPKGTHMRCMVTPEAAKNILETRNLRNREIRWGGVRLLKDKINDGMWQEGNPSPIAFDVKGHLADGQHRLSAIADANHGVSVMVAFGVPEDLHESMDIKVAGNRSLADRLHCRMGVTNTKATISPAKILASQFSMRFAVQRRNDHSENVDEIQNIGIKYAASYEFASTLPPARILSIDARVAMAEYHMRDPEKATEFALDYLSTVSCLSQVAVLKNAYAVSLRPYLAYYQIVGSMISHRNGKPMKSVRPAVWNDGLPAKHNTIKGKREY